jgi:hypothetical protein
MGLSFHTVTTMEQKDTYEVSVFYHMITPNINVCRVDMNRLTHLGAHKSITNAIMKDAERLEEIIPNVYAKFSILPYKFTEEGLH